MAYEAKVAVVVPAYNAADMIVETLRSVSAQTYCDIQIIVVDDGSSDGTPEAIEAYGREEPRLRLIRQPNGGVAAARNRGMAESDAPLIAPIDSDDLWHPERLAKHVAALERNPAAAFAYSPFRILNGEGRMIGSHPFFAFSGRVFYRQLFFNMVGNGSGMIFRREAALAFGGYDPSLRDAGLQGCEDWLLQMLMSIDHEVEHVPEYLIGYRKVPGAMSADTSRMWASRILAAEMLKGHAPPAAQPFIESAKLSFSMRLALQKLRKADVRQLLDTIRASFQRGLMIQLADEISEIAARSRRARKRRRSPGASFLDVDPTVRAVDDLSPYTRRLIERLRVADESPVLFEAPPALTTMAG